MPQKWWDGVECVWEVTATVLVIAYVLGLMAAWVWLGQT